MDNIIIRSMKEEAAVVEEVKPAEFNGYLNPYSTMLVESKNIIFRGAPGTGKTYYERENTASQQAAMFHEVKQIITDFAENNAMFQELELIVNTCHDNAMEKLRNDFPSMKEADIRLLCYIFVGFSPQVISLFMKDTVANVYARKSRLKSRIKSAETANKELFLALFG